MKKKLWLVVILLVVFSLGVTKVIAEELEPTSAGNYFETKVLPYIAGGGTAVVGSLVGFVGLIRKTKKQGEDTVKSVNDSTNAAIGKVETATKTLETQAAKISEMQTFVQEKVGGLNDDVNAFKESATKTMLEQQAMIEKQTAVINGFKEQMTQTAENQAKMTKAILIGFGNNAELVKNGYAREISELMIEPKEL